MSVVAFVLLAGCPRTVEQDKLADLLTRMFEEFSKSPDLVDPPSPSLPALDPSNLSSDYVNVIQQLRQLVKS